MAAAAHKFDPEVLDFLAPEERLEVERLMEDRYGAHPFRDFIVEEFPHEPPPEHVEPIIRLIERARHERIKVCLSLPPRHAKTVTILRGLVWWLLHEPADTCAYYSYSDTQARSKSRIARDWARQVGIELRRDTENTGEWRTKEGGGVLAGGLRSGLTGQGVSGLFVVDDPFKNREEADSQLIRDKVWDNFNEVVFTRLEGASVIVVHTRWHEDDLIGRLKEDPEWEVINIPAISEPANDNQPDGDPLGRPPGEALWPDRFSLDELRVIEAQIGPYSFASLYQGHPRKKGAKVFGEPRYYQYEDFDITGCSIVLGADPAASGKTTSDYSAACVMAVRLEDRSIQMQDWPEPRLVRTPVGYIQHVYAEQVTIPVFVDELRSLQRRWYNAKIGVEAVGGFKAVPQVLKHVDPTLRVEELPARGDKFQRAQPAAAMWNLGLIMIPAYRDGSVPDWVKPFVKEVCAFTGVNDRYDDQVDALAHTWNQVAYKSKPVRRGAVAVTSRWR